MADVDVKRTSSKELQTQEGRQQGRGLQRSYDPWNLSLIPGDFINNSPFNMGPFTLMRRVSDEMDRMFSSAFSGAGTRGAGAGGNAAMATWSPAIEVKERNNQLEVCADLPGLSADDVKVEVTNDAVILHGERKWESEEDQGGVHRTERHYGQFYRAIPIPDNANADQAKAQFKDGVLKIIVPVQQQNRRQIPIESNK